jgi:DNA-binding transcriptional ArsR family regulator
MDDLDSPEAFEVLTDETRVRILHALAEHQREHLDERALGFADLRRRVGMRDSGNFDYHLDRLRGEFVERTDEGYQLTPRGLQIVGALAAGTFHDHPSMEPYEVDVGCPNCGAEMILSYEEGLLQVACRECAEGPGISNLVAPEVVRDRSPEELLVHFLKRSRQDVEHIVDGVCPNCFGPLELSAVGSDVSETPCSFEGACGRCGFPGAVPPSAVALVHPALVRFAHEYGVDGDPEWALRFVFGGNSRRVAEEPLRHELTAELGGETLTLIVDDSPAVVEVTRAPTE